MPSKPLYRLCAIGQWGDFWDSQHPLQPNQNSIDCRWDKARQRSFSWCIRHSGQSKRNSINQRLGRWKYQLKCPYSLQRWQPSCCKWLWPRQTNQVSAISGRGTRVESKDIWPSNLSSKTCHKWKNWKKMVCHIKLLFVKMSMSKENFFSFWFSICSDDSDKMEALENSKLRSN